MSGLGFGCLGWVSDVWVGGRVSGLVVRLVARIWLLDTWIGLSDTWTGGYMLGRVVIYFDL